MMLNKNINNMCKTFRLKIQTNLQERFTPFVQNHVAHCPRCQKRMATIGRVHLALDLIKSQVHSIDLFRKANTKALNVLKRNLSETEKAADLKTAYPELNKLQKTHRLFEPWINAAACVLVILLLKTGIFSSITTFQENSKTVVNNYYANNLGQELADELFKT